jgi:hypothetical protein
MTAHDLKRTHRTVAVRRWRVVAVIGTAADADACEQVGRLIADLGCDLLTGAGGGRTQSEVELARRYGVALIGFGGQRYAATGIGRVREFLMSQLSEP